MKVNENSSRFASHLLRAAKIIAPLGTGQGRFCILNYHRILDSPDPLLESEPNVKKFRWQMKLLAESFNVIPLHAAVQGLASQSLPPRAVCITFDDGYRSTHDLALPILKELNLPATVFATTGYLDGGNMWNDRIVEGVRRLPVGVLDLRHVGLGMHSIDDLSSRKQVLSTLNHRTKYLTPTARRNVILELERLTGNIHSPGLMLTRDMLINLSQAGIEIGGHTVTHPILTMLDDGAAVCEIAENKQVLESIIGKPVRLFAYPNGKVGTDFDERHVRMVREAGYMAAFTTATGLASKKNDLYQIPRSRPWDSTPFLFGLRLLRWLAVSST